MTHSVDYKEETGTSIRFELVTPYSLDFPLLKYGARETPWDLSCLLYHGGAGTNVRKFAENRRNGSLTGLQLERLNLVTEIHQVMIDKLTIGGSRDSTKSSIRTIRELFNWAEKEGFPLNKDCITQAYMAWSDFLWHQSKVHKKISPVSAYSKSAMASIILNEVLQRITPLIAETRLHHPSKGKNPVAQRDDKQSLEEVLNFGNVLHKICDTLTLDVVMYGPSPVEVLWDNGQDKPASLKFYDYQGVVHAGVEYRILARTNKTPEFSKLQEWQTEPHYKTRAPIVNRRIEAELLIFIAQTSMNNSQACKLLLRKFRYDSYTDGYQVRDRKERRKGEVLFEIFADYKPHFERYLAWRRELFPESDKLFPFICQHGIGDVWTFQSGLRNKFTDNNLVFLSPRKLRNNKVNWLLRKTGDPDLTAEMAQHSKETLLSVYEVPSLHKSMVEISRYWNTHDVASHGLASVAPGRCNGHPVKSTTIEYDIEPDCLRPSGCIGCEQHRDIDSEDHVWALASFRHLKIIELSKTLRFGARENLTTAQMVVDRLTEKLNWFKRSNNRHENWLQEALIRVEEGNYHPSWDFTIRAMEGAL